MPLLAQLVVEYKADVSDLEKGTQRSIDLMQKVGQAASQPSQLAAGFTKAANAASTLASNLNTTSGGSLALAAAQAKAAVAADKVGVSEASAALALKKVDDLSNSGKASAEQIALAQARAALAADKIQVSEVAAAAAMAKAETEARKLKEAESGVAVVEEKAEQSARLLAVQMNAMSSTVHNVSNTFNSLSSVTTNVGSHVQGLVSKFLDFGNKLGGTINAVQSISSGLKNMGTAFFAPAAQMEQLQVGFTTLLGSAQAAGSYLQKLADFANTTPFEMSDVATDAQQLIAMGFAANDVIPILTDVGNTMSGLAKGPEAVQQIVLVFGQMHAATKVNAGDMMQLVDRGIPAWTILANSMHLTVPALQAMVSKGLVPADKAIAALRAGMTKMGSMKDQAQTWTGMLSTIQDSISKTLLAFSGPAFAMAKTALGQIGDAISSPAFQKFAEVAGQEIGGAITNLVTLARPVVDIFTQVGQVFTQSFTSMEGGNSTLQNLSTGFAFLGQLMSSQILPLANILGSVILGLVIPAISGFAAMLANPTFQAFATGVAAQINKILGDLGSLLVSVLVPAWNLLLSVIQSPGFQTFVSSVLAGLHDTLSNIVNIVGPLLQKFVDWNNDTGFLSTSFGLLGTAISTTSDFVNGILSGLASMVDDFQDNQVAADALAIPLGLLGGYLVYLGVTAIASFLAAAPEMIASFLLGAGAAWTFAAGVIAATWPFLLIGLIIGLVVAGIILAVQHWGEITAWFQGVWGAFTGWFMGIVQNVGNFFINLWAGIWTGLQNIWAGIVNVVQMGGQFLHDIVSNTVNAIVGFFSWLYDHNYYFKNLVDTITGFFTGLFNWGKDRWNDFTGWLASAWDGVSKKATEIWGNITTTVGNKMKEAGKSIKDNSTTASNWFHDRMTDMGKWELEIFEKIKKVASQLWNTYIKPPFDSFWNLLSSWWSNLSTNATQLGKNLVNWIVSGVKSIGGAIGGAIHDAISSGLSNLGFHDVPGFVGHAAGIINSPFAHMAVVGERGPELMYVPKGASILPNSFLSASTGGSSISPTPTSAGSGGGSQTIILYSTVEVDGEVLADITGQNMMETSRRRTGGKQ